MTLEQANLLRTEQFMEAARQLLGNLPPTQKES
jgi:hypothetical protein